MALFKSKKDKDKKKGIPDGLWVKCPSCNKPVFKKTLVENLKVCPYCNYHTPLTVAERTELLIDKDTFKEYLTQLLTLDPLEFKGPKSYKEKIEESQKETSLKDAAVVGEGTINDKKVIFGVTDQRFIMGSMGSVVGEKITYAAEKAIELKRPLVIISGSGGGARMYEGMLSLMQMAKTSASLARLAQHRIPFISVLTHPTMAGVLASFASLGDVIIAEPKALIGFTGPRVIEQTTKQRLPEGFQTSEFNLAHGLVDMVVERKHLKKRLEELIGYFGF